MDKPKRNEPCLCGSGKKFKQCCINQWDQISKSEVIPDSQVMIDMEVDEIYDRGWALLKQGQLDELSELIESMQEKYSEYSEPLELKLRWAEASKCWEIAADLCEKLANFTSPLSELTQETREMYLNDANKFRRMTTQ